MTWKDFNKSFAQWIVCFDIHVKTTAFDTTHFSSLGIYITFLFVLCYLFSFLGFKTMSFTHIIALLMAISLLLAFKKAVLFISPLSCPIGESSNLFELSDHIYKVKSWTRYSLWSLPILKLYAVFQKTWRVTQYDITLKDKAEEFLFQSLRIVLDTSLVDISYSRQVHIENVGQRETEKWWSRES